MYFDFGNVTTKASTPGGSISLSENLSLTIDSIRGNVVIVFFACVTAITSAFSLFKN